jgi:hypothetical protein
MTSLPVRELVSIAGSSITLNSTPSEPEALHRVVYKGVKKVTKKQFAAMTS